MAGVKSFVTETIDPGDPVTNTHNCFPRVSPLDQLNSGVGME